MTMQVFDSIQNGLEFYHRFPLYIYRKFACIYIFFEQTHTHTRAHTLQLFHLCGACEIGWAIVLLKFTYRNTHICTCTHDDLEDDRKALNKIT